MRFSPFEHCVYGPVHIASSGTGVPDGSNLPAIVLEHRTLYTIRPDASGAIEFALVPSMVGAFAIRKGIVTVDVNRFDIVTGISYGVNSQIYNSDMAVFTPASPANVSNYKIVPFAEWLGEFGPGQQFASNTLAVEKFWVVACVGTYMFTGTSLANSGTAVTARQNIAVEDTSSTPDTVTAWQQPEYVGRINSPGPFGPNAVAQLAGCVVAPVQDGGDMINVPHDFSYQALAYALPVEASHPDVTTDNPFAQLGYSSTPNQWVAVPAPQIGHADTTFVALANVAPTGSVTFASRTCVEYVLDWRSGVSRLAKVGPPADPAAVERVKALARVMPASKPAGDNGGPQSSWISRAWHWYLNKEEGAIATAWNFGANLLTGMASRSTGGMSTAIGQAAYNNNSIGYNRQLAIGY